MLDELNIFLNKSYTQTKTSPRPYDCKQVKKFLYFKCFVITIVLTHNIVTDDGVIADIRVLS